MAGLRYLCCSDARRAALEQRPDLNGIDFLEVGDLDPAELDAAALARQLQGEDFWQMLLAASKADSAVESAVTAGETPPVRAAVAGRAATRG